MSGEENIEQAAESADRRNNELAQRPLSKAWPDPPGNPEAKRKKCQRCDGEKTIRVLGCGGDYEDWPCPECQSENQR